MDIKNINDEYILNLAAQVNQTLKHGGKICVIENGKNEKTEQYRWYVSLWIIRDGSEAYKLTDLVTAMEVAKPMTHYHNRFSVCSIGRFMEDFMRQFNIYFGQKYDFVEGDGSIQKYYRFLGD